MGIFYIPPKGGDGTGNVSSTSNIADNAIVTGDGGLKDIQGAPLKVSDTGDLLPNVDNTSYLGSATQTFKNAYFKDSHGIRYTPREILESQLLLRDDTAITNMTVSTAVVAGVWTLTLSDSTGLGVLLFVIDGKTLIHIGTSLSLDITAYAGTDAVPTDVHVYVKNNGSDVPVLEASNTSPIVAGIEAVSVSYMKAGLVSTSSVTTYGEHSVPSRAYEFITDVYHRAWDSGTIYKDGMDITATSTNVTIASGKVKTIFSNLDTTEEIVGTDGLYYIKNDASYNTATAFDFGAEYSTGETITDNKFFNVILGIVKNGTSKIMALVQQGAIIPSGKEYKNVAEAQADKYKAIISTPSDTSLKKLFVPVCQIIVQRSGTTYTLQEIPEAGTGKYFIDTRGEGVSGGNVGSPITKFSDSDFEVYNDTDDTKKLTLDISGITTATTRDLIAPDKDGTLALLDDIVDPLTTKGDLFTFGTDNIRLPIGTNDQILIADSTTATGMKWGAGGGGDAKISIEGSGTDASATGVGSISIGGQNATATWDYAIEFGYNANAEGIKAIAIGYNVQGGGGSGIAIGDTVNAGGTYSVAIGSAIYGSVAYSVGIGRSALCTQSNAIAIGRDAKGEGTSGVAIAYQAKSGPGAGIGIGAYADAESTDAISIGAYSKGGGQMSVVLGRSADGHESYTIVLGAYSNATNYGEFWIGGDNNTLNLSGEGQLILSGPTTDATETEIYTRGASGNRLILAANSALTFDVKIIAYNSTDGLGASYKLSGGIRRDNANSTALIGTVDADMTKEEGAMTGCSVSVEADDTNEALIVKVTGLASKTISWSATIKYAKVGS